MIKVTFVSMWHSIVPASAALLCDELAALFQQEDEIEFWFHSCHLPTSQWFLKQIIKLKVHAHAEIKIVDVVDPLVDDGLIREAAEQLQYDKFEVDGDVRIQYAPDLNSRMKCGSKHFLARSNQVNRWMIDQCGWKGKALGPAAVHDKQALVLVNRGGAKGSDVLALSDAVRASVRAKFGIDIHPEVNLVGK